MDVDRNGLAVLTRDECLRLIEGSVLGRLAISVRALPVIFPVNFLLDSGVILIRTDRGTKFDAATRGTVVAFEVDDVDPYSHSGWSVCVVGTARAVTNPDELERIDQLPLAHWAPNGGSQVIAISTEMVTGRRIPYGHLTSPE